MFKCCDIFSVAPEVSFFILASWEKWLISWLFGRHPLHGRKTKPWRANQIYHHGKHLCYSCTLCRIKSELCHYLQAKSPVLLTNFPPTRCQLTLPYFTKLRQVGLRNVTAGASLCFQCDSPAGLLGDLQMSQACLRPARLPHLWTLDWFSPAIVVGLWSVHHQQSKFFPHITPASVCLAQMNDFTVPYPYAHRQQLYWGIVRQCIWIQVNSHWIQHLPETLVLCLLFPLCSL